MREVIITACLLLGGCWAFGSPSTPTVCPSSPPQQGESCDQGYYGSVDCEYPAVAASCFCGILTGPNSQNDATRWHCYFGVLDLSIADLSIRDLSVPADLAHTKD